MIHPTALVSPTARLGDHVTIGAFSIVHDGVTIGDNSVIEAYCEIGYPTPLAKSNTLFIGENSLIRSHSVFYLGSQIGAGLQTGHRVVVRENMQVGKGWRLGTASDIQGDSVYGDYVRMHSNVLISKDVVIGDFVWVFPFVIFTNDPHPPSDISQGVRVEDFAVIGARSTILPGLTIGTHSFVGANSCVTKNVMPNTIVVGVPAKPVGATERLRLTDDPTKSAYPWPKHFHRDYPNEVIEAWKREFA